MPWNQTKPICVQICADNEWDALKDFLEPELSEDLRTPFGKYVIKKLHNEVLIFFKSGATKTLAASACQFSIDNWEPHFIFVLGTAGGISTKLNPLDIVIANKTLQYDCISRMGSVTGLFNPEFITEIDNSWIDWENLNYPICEGIIATADQDIDYKVSEELKIHNVLVADWESGAIAPVCKLNNVPCCIIRGASDIPNEDCSHNEKQYIQYLTNTPLIMNYLVQHILPLLVKNLKKNNERSNITICF